MSTGINLLDTDDSLDSGLVPIADYTISTTHIPPAVRRSIIVEKANGASNKIIALRYDCSESTVARVWGDFVKETAGVRHLADDNPEDFKRNIRKKAVKAIENGLDCDRDPYRQGALGVQVMKGIGEFKTDEGAGAKVNILIGNVPNEWKERYIGAGASHEDKK